jgi:hypothetical protein
VADRAAAAQPADEEAPVSRRFLPDSLETAVLQPAAEECSTWPAERRFSAGDGESQETAGPEHPRCLCRGGAGVQSRQQVEVIVREGNRARAALLEGDPPLGVEADPGSSTADRPSRAVDPPDPGAWKLTREEKRPLALAALDLQNPLRTADVEDGGGKGGERRSRHQRES